VWDATNYAVTKLGEEKSDAAVAELTRQLLEQVFPTIYDQNLAAILSPTD
jgi:hypothetical protein